MMTILNRLRGTQGLWSKIIGLLLALVVDIAFGNPYVAIAVGLGYIIGESFGWGEWVGALVGHRSTTCGITEEGKNNGIRYIATKLVPNWNVDWLKYCRVALFLRGLYWFIPTLAPLYFVGFHPLLLLGCALFLGVGFPLACEIGYYLGEVKKKDYSFFGLSIVGGWEIQEVAYGVMQDLVVVALIVSYLVN